MPQPGVDLDAVAEVLQRIAPELTAVAVSRIDGGSISGAYEIACSDGADGLILKVYAEDSGWRLRKEADVYRILREHGVTSTARVLGGASKEDSPFGRPYMVMTRLNGTSLGQAGAEMSADEVAECYRQMGEILAQIHGIRQEAFGYLVDGVLDAMPTNLAYMTKLFAERAETYLKHGGDREIHDAAERYVAERADLFALCQTPVLVHSDFHEGNIIVDRTPHGPVVTGFVDMENAVAGDPLVDLAKTNYYSIRGDQRKLDALFAGYGSVPEQWDARHRLYQLVHDFELLAWSHDIGDLRHLDGFAADVRKIIALG
jgi:hygromycin-B 7''-O-kinase